MNRRTAVVLSAGLGLLVLVADLVYAVSIIRRLGRRPDEDFSGAEGGILLLWLVVAIAFAASGTYGARRGRVTWVWFAGVGEALSLVILVGIGRGFWAMFLGAGLVVLAAVIGGTRAGNLGGRPAA